MMEKIAIAIAIISVLVTIIIGKAAINSSIDIAERSGAFDRPQLKLYLGNLLMSPDKPSTAIFGLDKSIKPRDTVIGSLPITISNDGQKTAKNITVTFQYHEITNRANLESLEFVTQGSYQAKLTDRHFSKMGTGEYASYRIPELDPGVSVSINDPIYLQNTDIIDSVKVDDMTLAYKINYDIYFHISVSSEDIQQSHYKVAFTGTEFESSEDFNIWLSDERLLSEAKNLRRNTTFFEYLGVLLFRNIEKHLVLIVPKFEAYQIKNKNSTIYFSSSDEDKITIATYKLGKWTFLF